MATEVSAPMHGVSRRTGMSLLEILLATMMLTTVLIFIIVTMLGLLRSSTKGEDQQVALEIADRTLAQLASADESNWVGLTANPQLIYTHDPRTQTRFETVVPTPLKLNAAPTGLTMGELYDVTVIVQWWDQSTPTRQGYGLQSVRLTRTIYVERSPTSGAP